MRLHRFYIDPAEQQLTNEFWIQSVELRNQWLKVFRYRVGDEIVLFDGKSAERLYKINRIEPDAVQLQLVTEFVRKLPERDVYLFWSLLKKDKNEWVVQKCTELGVSHFNPILAERSEKTGFNIDRAVKIAQEAAEQCGRSDLPSVREPILIDELIREYKEKVTLVYCDEPSTATVYQLPSEGSLGVLIGPEGGWTEQEITLFRQHQIGSINLGKFTLRAETAAVVAAAKLVQ